MNRKTAKILLLAVGILGLNFPLEATAQDTVVESIDTLKVAGLERMRALAETEDVPVIEYVPTPPPKYWSLGILTQLHFTQVSLTNWSDGGDGSIALSAYVDLKANYKNKSESMFWNNRLQLGYGFVQNFGDVYKKSDDKIILDSKWGYKAVDKLFMSAIFNFKTQFTPGFKYPEVKGDPFILESVFMSPGTVTLGLGIDYKPFTPLAINFAPLTGNLVVVENKELREKYGNKPDQPVRVELGAQLKVDYAQSFFKDRLGIQSNLTLFSNFLDSPQNIRVNWDVVLDVKVTKFLSVNLRTNMIYDDKVLIELEDGHKGPRLQFKEALGVGLSYTFGGY